MTEENENDKKSILDTLDARYNEKYQEIKKEIESMFTINQFELADESVKHISKMHFYNSRLSEEKLMLIKIKRKMEEIHGELFEKYRFNNSFKITTKGEVEEWINRDIKWQNINTRYENQKVMVDHYQRVVEAIKDKGYMIKNLIDLKKIELGLR
jgi:DNA-binding FadR family transcriptional regulator